MKGKPLRHRTRRLLTCLEQITGSLPVEHHPELANLVNWGNIRDLPIHRWFRYREAFSPQLIKELSLGNRILDPFCGCGSIMVGAAEMGRCSVGIDINPLATFIARTKLATLSYQQLEKARSFLKRVQRSIACSLPSALPVLNIATRVFEPQILDTLLKLRTAISQYSAHDLALGDFLFLAWLSILERVGSYYKEGNGIKYRNKKRLKDGYIKRVEGEWQLARYGNDQRAFVAHAYEQQVSMMIDDAMLWETGTWNKQRIVTGSALNLTQLLHGESFDSIIFSPPYANRFDYFESLKVELWFGGFVTSYSDLRTLRKNSLRSHLGADLNRPYSELEPLEDLIRFMDQDSSSWRMGVPNALRGYFDDILHTLEQCRGLLRNGSCCVVVGNSAFAGVIVPTDALVAYLGLQAGFKKASLYEARHLTVAPQQRHVLSDLMPYMRESVVILQ